MSDRNEDYKAKYVVDCVDGGYYFKFFCSMCDRSYTTALITAGSVDDARVIAEKEARVYYNGCQKCRRWLCDEHYDMDEMLCTVCAARAKQKKMIRRYLRPVAAVFFLAAIIIAVVIALANNRPGDIDIDDEQIPLADTFINQTD